jgi:hypothetical protein
MALVDANGVCKNLDTPTPSKKLILSLLIFYQNTTLSLTITLLHGHISHQLGCRLIAIVRAFSCMSAICALKDAPLSPFEGLCLQNAYKNARFISDIRNRSLHKPGVNHHGQVQNLKVRSWDKRQGVDLIFSRVSDHK